MVITATQRDQYVTRQLLIAMLDPSDPDYGSMLTVLGNAQQKFIQNNKLTGADVDSLHERAKKMMSGQSEIQENVKSTESTNSVQSTKSKNVESKDVDYDWDDELAEPTTFWGKVAAFFNKAKGVAKTVGSFLLGIVGLTLAIGLAISVGGWVGAIVGVLGCVGTAIGSYRGMKSGLRDLVDASDKYDDIEWQSMKRDMPEVLNNGKTSPADAKADAKADTKSAKPPRDDIVVNSMVPDVRAMLAKPRKKRWPFNRGGEVDPDQVDIELQDINDDLNEKDVDPLFGQKVRTNVDDLSADDSSKASKPEDLTPAVGQDENDPNASQSLNL